MLNKFNASLIFCIILFFGSHSIIPLSYSADYMKYSKTSEKYIIGENGNILIGVNILGHVKNPGHHIVYEDIDIVTIISIAGGYLPGANLEEIILIRELADENNKFLYKVNLDEFYKTGNNQNLIKILPNDTIVIKEKMVSSIFRGRNTLNSILQILNIYLQISKN